MTAEELLREERATLLQRVKAIDKSLELLMGQSPAIKWTERSINCIRGKGHICLSSEILECLFWDDQTNLKDPKIRNNYMTGLSVALKNLVTNGNLMKESRPGVKGFYYGLPEWFDEIGKVKPEYDTLNEMRYEIE